MLNKLLDKKLKIIKEISHGFHGKVYLIKINNKFYALKVQKIYNTTLLKKKNFKYNIWKEIDVYEYINNLKMEEQIIFIKLYDYNFFNSKSDNYFISLLEYFNGITLKIFYIKNQNILYKENLSIFFQILKGITTLYKGGYIHNDLHNNNILIKKTNKTCFTFLNKKIDYNGYIIKIIDYGKFKNKKFNNKNNENENYDRLIFLNIFYIIQNIFLKNKILKNNYKNYKNYKFLCLKKVINDYSFFYNKIMINYISIFPHLKKDLINIENKNIDINKFIQNKYELENILNIFIFAFYCYYPIQFKNYFYLNNIQKVQFDNKIINNLFKCKNYIEIINLFLNNY